MNIFKLLKRLKLGQRGQSLVEMAITAPILLLLFIGVFEVGWALRGYLVLANVNRETARFAVKNAVLDFSVKNPATVGYNTVLSHSMDSLASQLPLEFLNDPNATVIMSHIVIDTGYPCVEYQGGDPKIADGKYVFDSNCNCEEVDPDAAQWFTGDDLIAHPGDPRYPHYTQTYGRLTNSDGVTITTRLGRSGSTDERYAQEAEKLALENNQVNCAILKTGSAGEISANNVFIAETFYEQPQLLGVPLISNAVTDPIPFYTHTAMRIVTSREADGGDTIGPVCNPMPITFPEETFTDLGYDPDTLPAYADPPEPPLPISLDLFEGSGSGNFGWLTWNPASDKNNEGYTEEELINQYLAMDEENGFTDVLDPDDHSLRIGSNVSSGLGTTNSDDIDDALEALVGQVILIPIYEVSVGSGANKYYVVSHFAKVKITDVCLPRNSCPGVTGSEKLIRGEFLGYQDDACG